MARIDDVGLLLGCDGPLLDDLYEVLRRADGFLHVRPAYNHGFDLYCLRIVSSDGDAHMTALCSTRDEAMERYEALRDLLGHPRHVEEAAFFKDLDYEDGPDFFEDLDEDDDNDLEALENFSPNSMAYDPEKDVFIEYVGLLWQGKHWARTWGESEFYQVDPTVRKYLVAHIERDS